MFRNEINIETSYINYEKIARYVLICSISLTILNILIGRFTYYHLVFDFFLFLFWQFYKFLDLPKYLLFDDTGSKLVKIIVNNKDYYVQALSIRELYSGDVEITFRDKNGKNIGEAGGRDFKYKILNKEDYPEYYL